MKHVRILSAIGYMPKSSLGADESLSGTFLGCCPITEPNDVAFVYVRRHGPGGGYQGCYTRKHMVADARRIRRWLQKRRTVFVYYNNDIDSHAVDNARQLIETVEA